MALANKDTHMTYKVISGHLSQQATEMSLNKLAKDGWMYVGATSDNIILVQYDMEAMQAEGAALLAAQEAKDSTHLTENGNFYNK